MKAVEEEKTEIGEVVEDRIGEDEVETKNETLPQVLRTVSLPQ